jgi:hypothetical protein
MRHLTIAFAATAAALLGAACASESPAPVAGTEPEVAEVAEVAEAGTAEESLPGDGIDDRTQEIAKAMCDSLTASKRFSFRAESATDTHAADGRIITLESNAEITVRRPNGLRVVRESVKGKRLLQYDGRNVSLLDVGKNLYAAAEAPATVDETLDAIAEKLGIVIPLADLVCDNPYPSFSDLADSGSWHGVHPVRGKPCDLLVFENEILEWQVWVSQAEPRVPLKLAIHYLTEPGVPRFVAHLFDWNLATDVPDSAFAFAPPDGAHRIEFESSQQAAAAVAAEQGR